MISPKEFLPNYFIFLQMLAHTCLKLPADFHREFPIGGTALSLAQAQEDKMVRKLQVFVCVGVPLLERGTPLTMQMIFVNPMLLQDSVGINVYLDMHNIFKAQGRVSVCSPPHYHPISHPLLLAPSFPLFSAPKLGYLQPNHCTLID